MDHEGVFLAFLANVGSRELPGFLPPGPPSALCPGTAGVLKAPPDPQLQGTMTVGHCIYLMWFTNNRLREKHTDFDGKTQGEMGGNHQKLRENSGKIMLKVLYEPCKRGGYLTSEIFTMILFGPNIVVSWRRKLKFTSKLLLPLESHLIKIETHALSHSDVTNVWNLWTPKGSW